MANDVRNIVKIRNLTPQQQEELVNRITTNLYEDDGETIAIQRIDFDKIIPSPRILAECPEDCVVTKDSHVETDSDRPWFDWYAWNTKYWGTKWGAYDCTTLFTKTTVTFIFSTAWSAPYPIYHALSDAGYDMEIKYADEDWGHNLGFIKVNKGIWTRKHEEDYKDPCAFARSVWDK